MIKNKELTGVFKNETKKHTKVTNCKDGALKTTVICDQSPLGRQFLGQLFGHWSCEAH